MFRIDLSNFPGSCVSGSVEEGEDEAEGEEEDEAEKGEFSCVTVTERYASEQCEDVQDCDCRRDTDEVQDEFQDERWMTVEIGNENANSDHEPNDPLEEEDAGDQIARREELEGQEGSDEENDNGYGQECSDDIVYDCESDNAGDSDDAADDYDDDYEDYDDDIQYDDDSDGDGY